MGRGRRQFRSALFGVTLVVLCAPAPALGQSVLERPARLSVSDQPLLDALRQLQRSAGISLVFSPDLIPGETVVSCSCSRLTVAQALDRLLEGTGLSYSARGDLVSILPPARAAPPDSLGAVAGRVVDAETGRPVANAQVWADGDRWSLSGRNGRFALRGLPAGVHRLRATALGWRQEEPDSVRVPAGGTATVTLVLTAEAIPLPEIVVQPGTFGLLQTATAGTARTLTRQEVRTLPQLGEDVFRAMGRLPGVATGDISTRLNLRGGSDRELMVRLDGIELYDPYHVMDWNGALGIVDINALGDVEVRAGGFEARYGDALTGVVDMTSREPAGKTVTTLGLSVTGATASSAGTFQDGRGAWALSGRTGFLNLIMEVANRGRELSPRYHDLFGKVTWELGSSHRLGARVLLAGDDFLLRDPEVVDLDAVDFQSKWHNRYAWVTWDAFSDRDLSFRTHAWLGSTGRRREGSLEDLQDTPHRIASSDHRTFTFAGVDAVATGRISDRAMVSAGLEAKSLRSEYRYLHRTWSYYATEENIRGEREDTVAADTDPEGSEVAAHATLRLRPHPRWTAEVGVRFDRAVPAGDGRLAPRITAAFQPTTHTNLRFSAGRYSQSHGLHELRVGDGESAFSRPDEGFQIGLGVDHTWPAGVGLRVELYRRDIDTRRPVFFNAEQDLKVFPEAAGDRMRVDPDQARARGVEVHVERRGGLRWAWAASYALAVAEDRIDGAWVPRERDQRHTLSLQAAFEPTPAWAFSAGWRFHSGWPATAWTWTVETLDDGWNLWTQEFGPLRAERLPAYHRLDLRVSRIFQLSRGRLQLFLDLFNVYNRTNLASWDYSGSYEGGVLTVERIDGQEMLPFLPTFGFIWEF